MVKKKVGAMTLVEEIALALDRCYALEAFL